MPIDIAMVEIQITAIRKVKRNLAANDRMKQPQHWQEKRWAQAPLWRATATW